MVGRVDAEGHQLRLDRLRADRQRHRPLVADGEEGMREGAARRGRVVVPGVRLAERRGVRHEPARVDRLAHRADLEADQLRGDHTTHTGGGKFMASTKIRSKSGWAASETCSMRAATLSARRRSVSETRQSWAPSAAALPTWRIRSTGRGGIGPMRSALAIET